MVGQERFDFKLKNEGGKNFVGQKKKGIKMRPGLMNLTN